MDIWLGLVEKEAPGEYNSGGYSEQLDDSSSKVSVRRDKRLP